MTRPPPNTDEGPGVPGEPGDVARRVDREPDPRYLLTVDETSKRLSISRMRVFGLIDAGQLISVKIGRSTRIPTKCIEEFIDRLISDPQMLARF